MHNGASALGFPNAQELCRVWLSPDSLRHPATFSRQACVRCLREEVTASDQGRTRQPGTRRISFHPPAAEYASGPQSLLPTNRRSMLPVAFPSEAILIPERRKRIPPPPLSQYKLLSSFPETLAPMKLCLSEGPELLA